MTIAASSFDAPRLLHSRGAAPCGHHVDGASIKRYLKRQTGRIVTPIRQCVCWVEKGANARRTTHKNTRCRIDRDRQYRLVREAAPANRRRRRAQSVPRARNFAHRAHGVTVLHEHHAQGARPAPLYGTIRRGSLKYRSLWCAPQPRASY